MSVQPGSALGHYEIAATLGAGGMGEVYRARDAKLGREVAIKVLLEEVAVDAERLARLDREAHVLASLNHPNIATLHGFEAEGDTRFLVMELVEGETLAERIAHGSIPVDEALALFVQIADGLEAAHEKGIVHRDLKPANVKITDDGLVKILDFGLAKAMEEETPAADLTHSPTLTRRGEIMGTAAYMSPEQARGKSVDRRADIWAFGCCLYEALAGKRAFEGTDAQQTLARILERGPAWDALPKATPAAVLRLLHRCMERDPRERLHDIADARIEIREAVAAPGDVARLAKGSPGRLSRSLTLTAAAVLATALVVSTAVWWAMRGPPSTAAVRRFSIVLPEGQTLVPVTISTIWGPAVAPDGSEVIYVARVGRERRLMRQRFDGAEAEPIAGTEDALGPFFSPDGRSVGFWAEGKVYRVSLEGGAPLELCEATIRQATWSDDGTIIFASAREPVGLRRIPDSGGKPEVLTRAEPGTFHALPEALPGGKAVLFSILAEQRTRVAALSLESGEVEILVEAESSWPRYSTTGHLLFNQDGRLMAAPFDPYRLEMTGEAVAVTESRMTDGSTRPHYGLSREGTLVYVPGGVAIARGIAVGAGELVWVTRNGEETPLGTDPADYSSPRFSPRGDRLAVARDGDIWIWDLARQTFTRLTFDPAFEEFPDWTPDGSRVAFYSSRGRGGIFWKAADGTGVSEALGEGAVERYPGVFSPSGEDLLVDGRVSDSEWGIGVVSVTEAMAGQSVVTPLIVQEHEIGAFDPVLSPDGRWLAFGSFESGSLEVRVRPYPGVEEGMWQISTGGENPLWGPDGQEIFYSDSDAMTMMRVEVETGDGFRFGRPEVLFRGDYRYGYGRHYDLHPDGERFILVKTRATVAGRDELIVVLNWFEELKRLVPLGD